MKFYYSAAIVVLSVLALPMLAGSTDAGEQVPFKARFAGVTTVSPLDPPIFFVLVNARGNATQLGRFTLAVPHNVNFATAVGTGSYQFKGANGDLLTASFSGMAVPTTNPVVLAIVENATITGGTGRFAGATGSFTCERLYNSLTGETIGSIDGHISTVGN